MSEKCPIYKGDEYVGCPFEYDIKCKDCHWFHKAKEYSKKGFNYFIDDHKSSLSAEESEVKDE